MRILLIILALMCAQVSLSQSIKVMTYNIRYDNPNDGINAWPNRKQKVVDLIKKYDPDVVGIQEALKHQVEELVGGLESYGYVGVGRDDGKQKGEYSAILFKTDKLAILESNTFWLSETPTEVGSKSWDAAITRITTWGRFSLKNTNLKIVIANTHFDHVGEVARKNSAELLLKKLPEISKNLPLILTGDFNTERNDMPYRTLIKPARFTLIDPAPEDPRGTFCGFEVGKIECRPIDYIFFTPHWEASSYQVINDNDGTNYPSDHLPVLVTVEFLKP